MRWLEIAVGVITLVVIVAGLVIAVRAGRDGAFRPFGAYLAAHAPEMICGVPLLVIGLSPSTWGAAWFVLMIALFLFLVLICNPLRIWDRLLPPKTRALIAAGVLVALLPFTLSDSDIMAQVFLWAITAMLWAVALWRRPLWLGLYRVLQCPDVDLVLSHLAHEGDWEPGRAWEEYGCRATRALLHQAIKAECDEGQMHRTYMPVYLLGFLQGMTAEEAKSDKAKDSRAELEQKARQLEEQRAEIASLKADKADLANQLARAKWEAGSAAARANALEGRLEDVTLTPQQRDAAVLAYVNAGHSYTEAGKRYGLSKSGAAAAYKRAKEAANAANEKAL